MNNSVNNTTVNRKEMIEMIQKRLDEIGVERFYLNPYNYNVCNYSEINWSKTKKDAVERYVIQNLAGPDYFEYTDWWEEMIPAIPKEVFTDPNRYPYIIKELYVEWDEYNPIVNCDTSTQLIEISFGNIKGCIIDGRSDTELFFRLPFDDLTGVWNNYDEILEFIWKLVNDPKMIKFNELMNKPDEYFEKENK